MLKKAFLSVLSAAILVAQPVITHVPTPYLKPEYRISIIATIENSSSFVDKRLYFKSKRGSSFNFLKLSCELDICSAILPKAVSKTLGLEYLFLLVDEERNIYKTQKYNIAFNSKGDLPQVQQNLDTSVPIRIISEIDRKPTSIEGFSDRVFIDSTSAKTRFGVSADLYTEAIAGKSTETTSTSVSVVEAMTGPVFFNSTLMYSAVGVVAAGAGAASLFSSDDEASSTKYDVSLQGDSSWNASVTVKGDSCTYAETSALVRAFPSEGDDLTSGSCEFTNEQDTYRFKTDSGDVYVGSAQGETIVLLEQGGSNVLVFTN